MTNFVRVGDAPYVINLEQVLYVTVDPIDSGFDTAGAIQVVMNSSVAGGVIAIRLTGDNAVRFMEMLNRQTGVW